MPELGSSGSVRGALRNERPYRERYMIVMAAHPGRLYEIIPVDLPYPRTEAIRLSGAFAEIRNRVWRAVYHQPARPPDGAAQDN
jgi:NitT/TauT family transport system ATP-binding protein